ncbi:spinster family MFS transporter [Sphingomonas baiyangensis]|uniref:spinster family MFS transporter n=1 Tax=Sphingomonas baiyangensis TaxID=2572576 RepID=UPI00146B6558|nr:MFS transporter [Sphingomonas baiyangensis]
MASLAADHRDAAERLLSRRYRARFLALLLAVCTLTFMDRAVLSAVAQPLKLDLGFSDFQLGLLQGLSFALLYATMGVPIGRLAERHSRLWILAISITVFSVATLLCGLATGFLQLFLLRMTVGVGEAGFMSPTSSLVGDHYPASQRASALSVIMLGSPIGNAIGAIAGGWIADEWGWRVAFYAMGAPGIVVAALLLILLREPPRGLAEGAPPERRPAESFGTVLRTVFAKRTYIHALAGATLATFGLVAIGQFQMVFFVRAYALSLTDAGLIQGASVFVALSLGTLIGGFGSDWAAKRDKRWSLWMPAIGVTGAAIAYSVGFLATSLPVSIGALLLGGMLLFLFYTPTYATAQNLVGPRMRATAVAIIAMCCGLVGSGLGPTWLGFASDRIAASVGGAEASATGIRYALASVTLAFLWSAIHYLIAARTLRGDLYQAPEVR